jgi:hypothetical protein
MPFSFKSLGFSSRPVEVSADVLRQLLQKERGIHPENAEFANSLWPEAGHFLADRYLTALILDEIDDEEVAYEIEEQKRFLDRLSSLLPALADLFTPADPNNIEGFCSCIDDCCSDYRTSKNLPRRDRQVREALEARALASTSLASALEAIEAIEDDIEPDYRDFHDLHFGAGEQISLIPRAGIEKELNPYSSIHMLIRQMRVCQAVLEITASETPEKLFSNSGKKAIVS